MIDARHSLAPVRVAGRSTAGRGDPPPGPRWGVGSYDPEVERRGGLLLALTFVRRLKERLGELLAGHLGCVGTSFVPDARGDLQSHLVLHLVGLLGDDFACRQVLTAGVDRPTSGVVTDDLVEPQFSCLAGGSPEAEVAGSIATSGRQIPGSATWGLPSRPRRHHDSPPPLDPRTRIARGPFGFIAACTDQQDDREEDRKSPQPDPLRALRYHADGERLRPRPVSSGSARAPSRDAWTPPAPPGRRHHPESQRAGPTDVLLGVRSAGEA